MKKKLLVIVAFAMVSLTATAQTESKLPITIHASYLSSNISIPDLVNDSALAGVIGSNHGVDIGVKYDFFTLEKEGISLLKVGAEISYETFGTKGHAGLKPYDVGMQIKTNFISIAPTLQTGNKGYISIGIPIGFQMSPRTRTQAAGEEWSDYINAESDSYNKIVVGAKARYGYYITSNCSAFIGYEYYFGNLFKDMTYSTGANAHTMASAFSLGLSYAF